VTFRGRAHRALGEDELVPEQGFEP
jgi:hypothetical protein